MNERDGRRVVTIIMVVVAAIVILWAALWFFTTVGAQVIAPQACGESLPCLRQRVKDLVDYREFADDQLALAKALNADLQAKLAACRETMKSHERPD